MKTLAIGILIGLLFIVMANSGQKPTKKAKVVKYKANRPDKYNGMAKAVAMIESCNNPKATRFEPHMYRRLIRIGVPTVKAKIMATSYGSYQILGLHYAKMGYKSVWEFRKDLLGPAWRQSALFRAFAEKTGFSKAYWNGNFNLAAYIYNGPKHRKNRYAQKLARYSREYKA